MAATAGSRADGTNPPYPTPTFGAEPPWSYFGPRRSRAWPVHWNVGPSLSPGRLAPLFENDSEGVTFEQPIRGTKPFSGADETTLKQRAGYPHLQQARGWMAKMQFFFELIWNQSRSNYLAAMGQRDVEQ